LPITRVLSSVTRLQRVMWGSRLAVLSINLRPSCGRVKAAAQSVSLREERRMQPHNIRSALSGALIAISPMIVPAAAQAPMALTGQVGSTAEGAMEGVLVSARKDGSNVTVTVASDHAGRFGFPTAKLAPGRYTIAIRAVGYELDGGQSVDVPADKAPTLGLALRPTRNLPKQLTNAEWLASLPGTDAQKKALLNCIGCHDLDRIVSSTHSPEEFAALFERMTGYYPGSTPQHPQRLVGEARRNLGAAAGVKALAEYLASINLSKDETWGYPLKTLPRPSGRATRVVITEYDLPRKQIQPHDVIVDSEGMVWFSHFGEQFLGRLDPRTGEVAQFPLPVIKPGYPVGTLDLETDKVGNLWIAMMYQGGVAKFDRKTQSFQVWKVPQEWQTDATQQAFVSPTAPTSMARSGSRTPIGRRSCGSIRLPDDGRTSARSRIPRTTTPSPPTASRRITRTTSICSISRPRISESSMPGPAS
jgi:virginiamycin B lyase